VIVIFELTISIIRKKNFLRWLMIFFVHVTRSMFKFLCNVLFCLTIFSIVAFWLNVFTLLRRTSCVNTTYVLFIVIVDEIMSFINVRFFLYAFWFLENLRAASDSRWINVALRTRFSFFFYCDQFLHEILDK
jgi:hypothetical protein